MRCNVDEGFCSCLDDRGCSVGESCNPLGRCQAESGCQSNAECRDGFFCDVVANRCVGVNDCGEGNRCCSLDSQCAYDQICGALTHRCEPGCRDEGDCRLGEACVIRAGQTIGVCDDEFCSADRHCAFGQLCSSNGTCVDDTRGPYCSGCAGGVQSDDCGDPGNFCLLDLVNGGSFCGVDCNGGEDCPNGYFCRPVIILPPAAPVCNAEACVFDDAGGAGRCSVSGGACGDDADCPIGFPGGDCARAAVGNCQVHQARSCSTDADCGDGDTCVLQECRFREGASRGTCSCTRATDCSLGDNCRDIDPSTRRGRCQLSGHDCFTTADCEAIIQCINGGCYIGDNCTPSSGRTCRDVRPVDPPPVNP